MTAAALERAMPTADLIPLDPSLTVPGNEAMSADHRWLFYFEPEDDAWHVCRRTWRGQMAAWMLFVSPDLDGARAEVAAGVVSAYLDARDGLGDAARASTGPNAAPLVGQRPLPRWTTVRPRTPAHPVHSSPLGSGW